MDEPNNPTCHLLHASISGSDPLSFSARLVKQVLGTLRAGYSAEISNGLVATMTSVETDAISIGILYCEIVMAI